MPKEYEDVEATLQHDTTPDTLQQKEKWRAIDRIVGATLGLEILLIIGWIIAPVIGWNPHVSSEHFTQFYFAWGLGFLSLGYIVLILWPIIFNIFKQGKDSKQDNDPRWFHARILSSGIVGGSYAFLLPVVMSLPEGSVNSGGAAALRQAILLATGGLIALIALGETRRKNDNDREAAENLRVHQENMLIQQKEQFEANAFKERKAERRERYTKAIEQLGDEKSSVRMGGVYTLVGLVDEWLEEESIRKYEDRLKEGQVIINNLCAYIRSPFTLATRYDELEDKDSPTSDGVYKDNQQEFYKDKADFKAEADVRLGIIKEIHDRLQDSDKNTPRAWSDFEYDFSGSTFFYPIDLTNSYYAKPINFSGSIYKGWADFRSSIYKGWADFGGSIYKGWADFGGSIYKGGADFRSSIYKGGADFRSSIYKGWADFGGSTYNLAYFRNSTYQERADFRGSTYREGAYFSGSTYREGAYFSGSTYKWVDFSSSTYQERVDFSSSTYQERVDFRGSNYQSADFCNSNYQSADFRSSIYQGRVDFSGSIYKWAYFGSSTYQGEANFSGSTYQSRATFNGSIFCSNTYFGDGGNNISFSRFTNCAPQFYDETNNRKTLFGSHNNDFTVDTDKGYPINLNSEGIPLGCKFLNSDQKEYLEYKFHEIERTNNKLLEVKYPEENVKLLGKLRSLNEELYGWREEVTTVNVEDIAAVDTES